jgi:ubiquinone biosynthesis protein
MRINIAKILISFLQKDYIKIAKLHIEAGIIPKNTDVNEFALQSLIIGESIVGKSVKDISFAHLLSKLLKMTRKYNMKTKTELLLLQKTIMLVEGIGVSLDKNLNIWDIAKPWVKDWSKTNIGLDAQIRDYSLDFIKKTQNILDLIKDDYELRSKNLQNLNKIQRNNASWKFFALTSFSLLVINILSKFNFFN